MSGVFDMVPGTAWGFATFSGSVMPPQRVVAILSCDAMTSSFQKGCFQQTCIHSAGQAPKAPIICQYQLSIFPIPK